MISKSEQHKPLVIDLDGTLLKSDMLYECCILFLRNNPLKFYRLFIWLFQGKAMLKKHLAEAVDIDVAVLPYDAKVLELIATAKRSGHTIVLATATHISLAKEIANHLNIFDDVIASDETTNLSAHRKRDALIARYGKKGFDYAGNSSEDIVVWQAASAAYVVNAPSNVLKKATEAGNIAEVITTNESTPKDYLKGLRIHQWLKNILIFVPLLAGHELTNTPMLAQACIAFLCFGLCASSVYVLNDLLDLQDDRHHSKKKNRAFASGKIPIKHGMFIFPTLLFISFILSIYWLSPEFIISLVIYYIITLMYSLYLKRQMTVDVITLAFLYTIRIIAGAAAMGLSLTFWLLTFSMFVFLSLALVKRYAELNDARARGETEKTRGRGYYPADLEMISSLGGSAGYLSVMVLALYIHDNATTSLYSHPQIIWLACPILLYWITRMWMLTHRGQMHEDPVVFAAKDKISLIVGVLFGLVFWVAT
ncbi:UbiA family prenyltransferase [Pseudomonas syringae group sp. J309-1]|uniref:UbiA family prenyltransferase n=1 Tax=Pseudomonas syringae group sp. J309-1 TaxID=3079588 RepID=UPI002914CC7B|nr:UbiA family prenyltransferase [Pseudomonas syringae group sp. J309-1]MDU8361881.1 UbiA family prenyltransferase [Pseudomonas syringae group sp. J309-1]